MKRAIIKSPAMAGLLVGLAGVAMAETIESKLSDWKFKVPSESSE